MNSARVIDSKPGEVIWDEKTKKKNKKKPI
jgi:hypothetical protein